MKYLFTLLFISIAVATQAQRIFKKVVFANGDVYAGEVIGNNMPDGNGKRIWSYGKTIYEGDWLLGKITGYGKCTWQNGDVYEGDWLNGQMNGKGRYTTAKGKVQDGFWEKDQFRGAQSPFKFHVMYGLDRDANGRLVSNPVVKYLRGAGTIDLIVNRLSATFNLSRDVLIRFRRLNQVNAIYDADGDRNIDFSLELVNLVYQNFAPSFNPDSSPEKSIALQQAVADAVVFILFHEVGHCLISMYNIPVTGNEEISADEFACYLLASGNDDNLEKMALRGALALTTMGSIAWDEHPFGEQRYYDILCKLYGKNPSKYSVLVTEPSQAESFGRCAAEYQKMVNSWSQILGSHFRK